MPSNQAVWKAIAEGQNVLAPDGSEVKVHKIKNGKAILLRVSKDGMLQKSAWTPIEQLKVKPI